MVERPTLVALILITMRLRTFSAKSMNIGDPESRKRWKAQLEHEHKEIGTKYLKLLISFHSSLLEKRIIENKNELHEVWTE